MSLYSWLLALGVGVWEREGFKNAVQKRGEMCTEVGRQGGGVEGEDKRGAGVTCRSHMATSKWPLSAATAARLFWYTSTAIKLQPATSTRNFNTFRLPPLAASAAGVSPMRVRPSRQHTLLP